MNPAFESNVMDFEQSREHAGDDKLFVAFYKSTELNEQKSIEAGRPVHDEVELIKIIVPGQRDSVVAKATHDYQQRFPKQWAQFKNNATQIGSGTPLKEVSFLTMAQVADLGALNVHTIEQLAGLSDAQAHNFMGFQSLKQRAQSYMEAAAGTAPLLKLQAQIDELAAKNAELMDIINQQRAALKPAPAAAPAVVKK